MSPEANNTIFSLQV